MGYRKKPVEIEAVQWTGENAADVLALAVKHGAAVQLHKDTKGRSLMTVNNTPVYADDWLVCDAKGHCLPVDPDIFAATYEPVEAAS